MGGGIAKAGCTCAAAAIADAGARNRGRALGKNHHRSGAQAGGKGLTAEDPRCGIVRKFGVILAAQITSRFYESRQIQLSMNVSF